MSAEAVGTPAAPSAVPAERPEVIRLRDGVARVRRGGGAVLVPPGGGLPIVVNAMGDGLMPLLARGASRRDLEAHLRERCPNASDLSSKLQAFLGRLERSGLLESSSERPPAPPPRRRRIELVTLDPMARILARGLVRVPRAIGRSLLILLTLAAAWVTGVVLASPARPHPAWVVDHFDALGLAVFVLLAVPLHELAHAIACRAAGAPVGRAGIVFHGGVIPGPYVDTSDAYRVSSRWSRFWIPGCGPIMDLFAAAGGAALVVLTGGEGRIGAASQYLLVLSLFFLYFDTNPLVASDGSRALEALLDDDLARRTALTRRRRRLSSWHVIVLYRLACVLHVAATLALVSWLIRS
jgi:hypothetical protein